MLAGIGIVRQKLGGGGVERQRLGGWCGDRVARVLVW